jgi:hypothetical protein
MSPLAAVARAEALIVQHLPAGPEALEALRALQEVRAEILRQAVEAAETFRESPRRDPARRATD